MDWIKLIKVIPTWVLIFLCLYIASITSWALYKDKNVDFFPPKIYGSDENTSGNKNSNKQLIVLQVAPEANLNSFRLANSSEITIIDVDSLSNSELKSVLDKIRKNLQLSGTVNENTVNNSLEIFFQKIVRSLDFGPEGEAEALGLFLSYTKNAPDIDEKWAELIERLSKKSSNPKNFLKRIKSEPFAIVNITENKVPKTELVLPGDKLKFGEKLYSVPVIANPSLTVTRGLHEAIALKPEG